MGTRIRIEWRHAPNLPAQGDVLVWLDVAKVEASFQKSGHLYVGPGGGDRGYAWCGRAVREEGGLWLGYLGLDRGGQVVFTDGRHRFAWCRDHGVEAMLFTTGPESLRGLLDRFDTELRSSWAAG